MRWWSFALLIGCYRPAAYDECNTLCGTDIARTCPSGQTCDDNGVCKPTDLAGNCPPREAGVFVDAFEFQDAEPDGPATGLTCFGSGNDFFRVCVAPPGNDRTISDMVTFNTDDTVLCRYQVQSSPPAVCVVAFRTLTITPTGVIRVVGGRPLAIVVVGVLTIDGLIDAASHRGGEQGANGNVGDCNSPAQGSQSASQTGGGGGGAGGALGGDGGRGGNGAEGAIGGSLTQKLDAAKLLRVRGGCPGASGGKSTGGGGGGGAGGGAIYLMSKTAIAMTDSGRINASGAAALSPGARGGGGGGGSGGFIGFASPMYMIASTARIFAIGGPGSSGGGNLAGGMTGVEAVGPANTPTTMGVAGSGSGGFGSFEAGDPGATANAGSGGGGGGGGGGGIIGFEGQASPTGTFAPMPVPL